MIVEQSDEECTDQRITLQNTLKVEVIGIVKLNFNICHKTL